MKKYDLKPVSDWHEYPQGIPAVDVAAIQPEGPRNTKEPMGLAWYIDTGLRLTHEAAQAGS